MSVILLEFLEPYRRLAHDDAAVEKLIALGVVGWNVSLLPEEQREKSLDDLANSLFTRKRVLPIRIKNWIRKLIRSRRGGEATAESTEVKEFKEIVLEMVEHKLKHFKRNRRMILSYHVEARGDDVKLFVASTLEGLDGR